MTVTAVRQLPAPQTADSGSSRSDALVLLQIFAIAVMVFPSDTVLRPIGAAGYPASLVGMFILAVYTVSVLFGFHRPPRHAIQVLLCIVWLSVLASYLVMDRGAMTGLQLAAADRVLIRYGVITGIALVASEWLRTMDDVTRVVRVLCWAGAFCGFVAVVQFWLSVDLSQFLRQLPGFSINRDSLAIQARGSLNRVAGTAISPIELGVVAGMLLPFAIWLGLYEDKVKPWRKRWGPAVLIGLGVATSVSRSGIVSVITAFAVLVMLMPPKLRLSALCALPFAVGAIFMSAHGLIGTLLSFFAGASSDPSIRYRTHDYPLVEEHWMHKPIFGEGPGTWMPADPLNIFDNQYLNTVVELGTVGFLVFLAFLIFPAIVALHCRSWTTDPQLRLLCACVAGAAMAATVSSFTFDSMSFPMFVNVFALIVGFAGACWHLSSADRERAFEATPLHAPTPIRLTRPTRLRPRRAES